MSGFADVVSWIRHAATTLTPDPEPSSGAAVAPSAAVPARRFPAGFVQPDRTTCGSSCLVMARMLGDPDYAAWIATGVDGAGEDGRTPRARFAAETLSTHRRTNRWSDATGVGQVGWPRQLGTTPWALANELRATGGTAPAGTEHRVVIVSPRHRAAAYDEVVSAVALGHAVPVFVGNAVRPGHIVLVVSASEGRLTAYDPASGGRATWGRDDFGSGSLRVSGWSEPWFTVLPAHPH